MKNWKYQKGFTLIEMAIVIGITSAMFALSLPFMIKFYNQSDQRATRDTLVGLLQQSRSYAGANRQLMSYGIHIGSTKFTLFKGYTYATRDTTFDYDVDRSTGVTITGVTDVIFQPLSMRASSSTVTLSDSNFSTIIQINAEGRINF